MPTYQYECTECSHRFEVFQSMTDEPVRTCEKCKGTVRKRYNAAGIIFKGSGFYVNDYKNGTASTKTAGSGDSPSCPAAGSCSSTTCAAAASE